MCEYDKNMYLKDKLFLTYQNYKFLYTNAFN